MKPTPMTVADVRIPNPSVTATGTVPTSAKPPPIPITSAAPRYADDTRGMTSLPVRGGQVEGKVWGPRWEGVEGGGGGGYVNCVLDSQRDGEAFIS